METIVNFLHEWAIPGLLLCILILVIIGIRQHRVNNAVSADEEDNESSGEGELPLAEESPADEETGNAEAEQVAAAAENAEVRQEPAECLLPPRRPLYCRFADGCCFDRFSRFAAGRCRWCGKTSQGVQNAGRQIG